MNTLYFKDSYFLLPNSLRKLCKSFDIKDSLQKGIFPYKLYDINYKGICPDFNFF